MPSGIGGTVGDLLDVMALLNNELDVAAGGNDESRAIRALSLAQQQLENLLVLAPYAMQSTVTVSAASQTETSTWSTSLLRLDALWYLDPTTSRPVRKLKRIFEIGGHVPALPWPLQLVLPTGVGAPDAYYGNMANFYWLPLPDQAYTMRAYGLIAQAEFTARGDAFNYQKRAKLPLASFAVKLLNVSVDDGPEDYDTLAQQTFGPLVRALRKFDRSEPMPRYYNDVHVT